VGEQTDRAGCRINLLCYVQSRCAKLGVVIFSLETKTRRRKKVSFSSHLRSSFVFGWLRVGVRLKKLKEVSESFFEDFEISCRSFFSAPVGRVSFLCRSIHFSGGSLWPVIHIPFIKIRYVRRRKRRMVAYFVTQLTRRKIR
jgi:hypothetical protein